MQTPKRKFTSRNVQSMLEQIDWDAHWERVIEKVGRDSDAYHLASAESYVQSRHKVFV